jgi:hypothetical protein
MATLLRVGANGGHAVRLRSSRCSDREPSNQSDAREWQYGLRGQGSVLISPEVTDAPRASKAWRPILPLLLTACSVAGGSWLVLWGREVGAWVDVTGYREAALQEGTRIASLARALLLAPRPCERRLCPSDVSWLIAQPCRVACLIDFLMSVEDLARVMATPLRILFTPMGQVRWYVAVDPEPTRPPESAAGITDASHALREGTTRDAATVSRDKRVLCRR